MLFDTPIFIEEGKFKPDELLLETLKEEECQRQKRVLTSMTAGRQNDSSGETESILHRLSVLRSI